MDEEPVGTGVEPEQGQVRTFLIADVRGWTLFTQQRGDEVAAKLAAKFAGIAREVVAQRGGEVIELRGDEALAVFTSTRQAVRAAVDLQVRFVEETIDDPELPLPVGIGLDAGEAVPVEGGYRGGALNLAARLCGQAKAGEILASRGVTHLARKVEGVRYLDRGTVRLKNLTDPVEPCVSSPRASILPKDCRRRCRHPGRSSSPGRAHPRRRGRRDRPRGDRRGRLNRDEPTTIAAGAVGLLDPSGGLEGSVEVGELPRGATGLGALWVTDQESQTLVRVDPTTFQVDARIPVGAGPTGVATAAGFVWVANTDDRTISVVDPDVQQVVQTIVVGNGPAGLAADGESVWVANSVDATVSEIDGVDGEVVGTYPVGERPVDLAVAAGAIWVANERGDSVSRVVTGDGETQTIPVGRGPTAIDAHGGALDRECRRRHRDEARSDDGNGHCHGSSGRNPGRADHRPRRRVGGQRGSQLRRADRPRSAQVSETVGVGNAPHALAGADDGVWVGVQAAPATHRGGTLRVVSELGLATVDPMSDANTDLTASVMSASYDGLVTLGGRLVPPG